MADTGADMEVDKVADAMANMEVHKVADMVADMKVDMVADKEVDKLADMVAGHRYSSVGKLGQNFFDLNLNTRLACLLNFASLFDHA